MPKVALIMGSKSDAPSLEGCVKVLRAFGMDVEVHVASAHRTPEKVAAFASAARENGFEVHCKPSSEIDTRSISEVAVGTGGKVTLKLYSKERALFKLWEIVSGEDPEIPGGGDIFDMLKSGENE